MKNFLGSEGFWWSFGCIEDIADPMKLGRARVRVLGIHTEDLTEIPTAELPWAVPIMPVTDFASPTGLKYGDWCLVFFQDGPSLQEPIILGKLPGIPKNDGASDEGFKDNRTSFANPVPPKSLTIKKGGSSITEDTAAAYPIDTKEQTTSRIARNDDISETIIQTKKDNVQSSVSTAKGGSFSEPASSYNAVYPYNNVIHTESGHVIEFDDTKGAERVHIYHRSGSFDETAPDGSKVEKVVNDKFTIILKSKNEYVGNASNETIEKGKKLFVMGGKYEIQVGGSNDMTVDVDGGSQIETIGKDKTQAVSGKIKNVSTGTTTLQGSLIFLN